MSDEIPIHTDPAVALRQRWRRRWICVALVVILAPVAGYWGLWRMPGKSVQAFLWKLRPPVAGPGAIATVKAQIASFDVGLLSYRAKAGVYPTQEQGLEALVTKPTDPPIPAKWSAIMKTLPRDPWNHPFVYRIPSTNPAMAYDLLSFGPDGIRSGDDIVISTPKSGSSKTTVFKLPPSRPRGPLDPILRLETEPATRRGGEDFQLSPFELRL